MEIKLKIYEWGKNQEGNKIIDKIRRFSLDEDEIMSLIKAKWIMDGGELNENMQFEIEKVIID